MHRISSLLLATAISASALAQQTLGVQVQVPNSTGSLSSELLADASGGFPVLSFQSTPTPGWQPFGAPIQGYEDLELTLLKGPSSMLQFAETTFQGQGSGNTLDFVLTRPTDPQSATAIQQNFNNWQLDEVGFPALDASSKESCAIKLRLSGGSSSEPASVLFNPKEYNVKKEASLSASNFKVTVTGVDCSQVSNVGHFSFRVDPPPVDEDGDGYPAGTYFYSSGDLKLRLPTGNNQDGILKQELAANQQGQYTLHEGEVVYMDSQGTIQNSVYLHGMVLVGIHPAPSVNGVASETIVFRPNRGDVK